MNKIFFFFFYSYVLNTYIDSQCAPVFAWREGTLTKNNGEIIRIQTGIVEKIKNFLLVFFS